MGPITTAASSSPAPTVAKQPPLRRRDALFDDDLQDVFGQWPVGYIPVGGIDMGEIVAIANAVGDGDDSVFYDTWMAAAETKYADAEAALAAGHRHSARELFLRSSCLYAAAYHPIYGTPVDPRLLRAFRSQTEAFRRGMELLPTPVYPTTIPYDGTELPAYLVPAFGCEQEVRPLLILNNGYDSTITDIYFAAGVAALRRGYHVLMFDGPGQGSMLYEHGVPLRPDWEVVISAVVDYAETLDIVDPEKMALSGWSLGGYLVPRAASGEPRLAACIADPGQWDIAESLRAFAMRFGVSADDVADLDNLPAAAVEGMWNAIQSDQQLRWKIVQRGFWANDAENLREFISKSAQFTLKDRVGDIRCPTLLTAAENDPLAAATKEFYDALTCDKTLLRFTAAEGAGEHCEMTNRSLVNQRVLDWLDDTLAPGIPGPR